jgi:pyruvate formate lyase activating enzyme
MADTQAAAVPREAKSPFEIRVNLSKELPETDVQSALDSGDMGFLHSFTTGSTVDGPGVRVVVWTTGCMWRCRYCHNPDTWTMRNGYPISVAQAADEIRSTDRASRSCRAASRSAAASRSCSTASCSRCSRPPRAWAYTTIETNGFLATA